MNIGLLIKRIFGKKCTCDKMKSYNDSDDLIIKLDDKTIIASEGGQKGEEEIYYCPFCGCEL